MMPTDEKNIFDLAFEEEKRLREEYNEKKKTKKSIKLFTLDEIVQKLKDEYEEQIENMDIDQDELMRYQLFLKKHKILGSEYWFCPEDFYYDGILQNITKKDVIFDIGAGNFQLDILMCKKAKKVYAIEIDPILISDYIKVIGYSMPKNLIIICGNGFDFPIPIDVTTVICLMIHRQHEFNKEILKRKVIYATHGGLGIKDPSKNKA
jgi:SAM-dependent methyltransferase